MLSGFGQAKVKPEGSGVEFDKAQETFTARYTHETISLGFAITEEAIEDNLYDRLAQGIQKHWQDLWLKQNKSKQCLR